SVTWVIDSYRSSIVLAVVARRPRVRGRRRSDQVDGGGVFLHDGDPAPLVAWPAKAPMEPAAPGQRGGGSRAGFGLDRGGGGLGGMGHVLRHGQPGSADADFAGASSSRLSMARVAGTSAGHFGCRPALVDLRPGDATAGVRQALGRARPQSIGGLSL